MNVSNITKKTFIDALVNFLLANKSGEVSLSERTKLFEARVKAEEELDVKTYGEAVFEAFRQAGMGSFG